MQFDLDNDEETRMSSILQDYGLRSWRHKVDERGSKRKNSLFENESELCTPCTCIQDAMFQVDSLERLTSRSERARLNRKPVAVLAR